jgi:hypothetical protein
MHVYARIEDLRVHALAKLLVLFFGDNLLVSRAKQAFKSILFPQRLCLQTQSAFHGQIPCTQGI